MPDVDIGSAATDSEIRCEPAFPVFTEGAVRASGLGKLNFECSFGAGKREAAAESEAQCIVLRLGDGVEVRLDLGNVFDGGGHRRTPTTSLVD